MGIQRLAGSKKEFFRLVDSRGRAYVATRCEDGGRLPVLQRGLIKFEFTDAYSDEYVEPEIIAWLDKIDPKIIAMMEERVQGIITGVILDIEEEISLVDDAQDILTKFVAKECYDSVVYMAESYIEEFEDEDDFEYLVLKALDNFVDMYGLDGSVNDSINEFVENNIEDIRGEEGDA